MNQEIGELKTPYKRGNLSFPIKCLCDGIGLEEVKWAHGFGAHLASGDKEKLTTTQLRKFFGELRRIEAEAAQDSFAPGQLIMLIPKLAYAVGRARKERKGERIEDFFKELSLGISKVTDFKEFKNFIKVVEAIVAYHKVYE